MANAELTVQLTPKVVKVTADVELHVDGRCVGTATVDLTPKVETKQSQQTPHAADLRRHGLQQTSLDGPRT